MNGSLWCDRTWTVDQVAVDRFLVGTKRGAVLASVLRRRIGAAATADLHPAATRARTVAPVPPVSVVPVHSCDKENILIRCAT